MNALHLIWMMLSVFVLIDVLKELAQTKLVFLFSSSANYEYHTPYINVSPLHLILGLMRTSELTIPCPSPWYTVRRRLRLLRIHLYLCSSPRARFEGRRQRQHEWVQQLSTTIKQSVPDDERQAHRIRRLIERTYRFYCRTVT